MKKLKQGFVLLFALFIFSSASKAQVQFSGWLASFNTFKLNNRLSLHFDAQLRSTDQLQQVSAILLRPGLNFHLNKTWMFTAGYLLNLNRRNQGGLSELLGEHRLWQQALANQKINKIALAHRLRFEERFIPRSSVTGNELETNGYDQAFRLRYFVRSIFPLTAGPTFSEGPFFALQNEVFLHTGNKTAVNGKAFDQNRLYGAIGYRLRGKLDIEAGYLNQYINTRSSFINNHLVQLALYKRL